MVERVRGTCQAAWDLELPTRRFEVRVAGSVPMSRGLGSSSTIYLGLGGACRLIAGRELDRDEH